MQTRKLLSFLSEMKRKDKIETNTEIILDTLDYRLESSYLPALTRLGSESQNADGAYDDNCTLV